jgi:hypothetical protein
MTDQPSPIAPLNINDPLTPDDPAIKPISDIEPSDKPNTDDIIPPIAKVKRPFGGDDYLMWFSNSFSLDKPRQILLSAPWFAPNGLKEVEDGNVSGKLEENEEKKEKEGEVACSYVGVTHVLNPSSHQKKRECISRSSTSPRFHRS